MTPSPTWMKFPGVRRYKEGFMSTEIKELSVEEFWKLGFLQEVNRKLLHPCGLALEISIEDDGSFKFGRIWDYREDPEGIAFGADMIDPEKVAYVARLMRDKAALRAEKFGDTIQPLE